MRNELRKKIQNYSYGLNDHLDLDHHGNIFKGVNEPTEERVAIKVVDLRNRQPEFVKEYLSVEIEALKKLKHCNIIQCLDIYSTVNNCYIITEFCDQGDLQNRLNTRSCFKETEAVSIFRDVFNGFHFLSQQKFIHGNLKPSCLLIRENRVKISGFSNCRKIGKQSKRNVKYNPFQSPESVNDNIFNHKSDIWSLSMILYLMLHGNFPWDVSTKANLLQNHTKPYNLNKQLSEDLKQFLKKGLTTKQNRINFQDLTCHPFIRRILDNNYLSFDRSLGGSPVQVIEPRSKKDSFQHMLSKTEKQINCQINWMRYLMRLMQKLVSYLQDTNTVVLKFIVIKQMITQYQLLKKALQTNQNTFGFANWPQYIKQKQKMNKYKEIILKYEVRIDKWKILYVKLIQKLKDNREISSIVNSNYIFSQYNCMVAIKASLDQIKKLWQRITKEYQPKVKYDKSTPFKFKSELLLLDFIITYYQLNCLLIDEFHRLDYFQKMSKLDVILQHLPAELDLTHLDQFQLKLTQLTILP